MTNVAVLVGSLRAQSVNRNFAVALAKLARSKLQFRFVEIGDLPLYNQDLESDLPAAVQRFKSEIEAADAVLFVTPEFNRTFSSALKNAIEWGTRPWGKNSFAGKPGAVVGATLGVVGTAAAQSQLRSVVSAIGVALIAQPEIYLNFREGQFVDGEIADEGLRTLLTDWTAKFADWIARLRQPALSF
ncbi:NADPH-dependent FMN reductase [Terricaulis sp.]|uniref:NADPH-dependent FMN reductase n=1 Tax=Terricaulis sp. TaxID=2768686 RepID=UPI003784525B